MEAIETALNALMTGATVTEAYSNEELTSLLDLACRKDLNQPARMIARVLKIRDALPERDWYLAR